MADTGIQDDEEELPPYLQAQLMPRSIAGVGPPPQQGTGYNPGDYASVAASAANSKPVTAAPKSIAGNDPASVIPPPSVTAPPKQPLDMPTSAPGGPNLASDVLAGNVAPPQWKDYRPQHISLGRKIAAYGIGSLAGMRNPELGAEAARSIAYGPQLDQFNDATKQYKGALDQGEQGQKQVTAADTLARADATAKSEDALRAAQAGNQTSEANARDNPKDEWSAIAGFQGPHGEPVEQNRATGEIRVATGVNTQRVPTAEVDTERATQIRADQAAGKPVTPEDAAWLKGHTQEKTIVPATTNILNQPDKASARSDKSFQYNQTALDKIRTPIDALSQRFSRLTDTLNQASPQADALVAPELLSVMAGGVGSGVRMNEPEISRIVGGRSKWQDLQAAIQKWSTDPKAARSITAEQDRQIRSLIQSVGQKVTAKQSALEDAQNDLLDSEDPKEHRKIVADARKKLDDIDAGEAETDSGRKTYTDAEVEAAVAAHPGMTAAQIEKGYKDKGYTKAKK